MTTPSLLKQLVRRLGFLPGLGPRSAKRLALYLLENKKRTLHPLITLLQKAADTINPCSVCGYMDTTDPCTLCTDNTRDASILCIVGHIPDVWAIERADHFQGKYHILGGLLSVLDGIGPADLRLSSLWQRLAGGKVQEIILALPPTLEGSATVELLLQELTNQKFTHIKRTVLARGVPSGGELDFLDEETLKTALERRHALQSFTEHTSD